MYGLDGLMYAGQGVDVRLTSPNPQGLSTAQGPKACAARGGDLSSAAGPKYGGSDILSSLKACEAQRGRLSRTSLKYGGFVRVGRTDVRPF